MDQAQKQNKQGPTAAQISLQSFTLPEFPPHGHSLLALTLTCDISLDDYTSSLTQPFELGELPPRIESLTLELFSLGFPAGFLTQLAEKLPNLRELVIFQQLLGGVTKETRQDAVAFFECVGQGLRALHLLDVFAPPGVIRDVAVALRKGGNLKFLEVSYATNHEADFLDRLPGEELPSMLLPSLIACEFNIAAPESDHLNDEQEGNEDTGMENKNSRGVTPLGKSYTSALVKALTDDTSRPKDLKALNTTLYTLTVAQLGALLKAHPQLLALSATIELDTDSSAAGDEEWTKLLSEVLAALSGCKNLEQVELVGVPGLQFSMAMQNPRRAVFERVWPSEDHVKELATGCEKLAIFQGNVLRRRGAGTVEWRLEPCGWRGGIVHPSAKAIESAGTILSRVEEA